MGPEQGISSNVQEQRQANDEQQVEMVDPEEEETDASAPWARRPGENERWYGRFTLYRLLGSRR